MNTLLQDLRYGFRMLLKQKGLTVVALLMSDPWMRSVQGAVATWSSYRLRLQRTRSLPLPVLTSSKQEH